MRDGETYKLVIFYYSKVIFVILWFFPSFKVLHVNCVFLCFLYIFSYFTFIIIVASQKNLELLGMYISQQLVLELRFRES